MKVIYYSKSFFADCDFPLVNELEQQGVDVRYYVPLQRGFKCASILEFSKPWKKWGIYKASSIKDMQIYKDCLNLNKLYFISGYTTHSLDVFSWLLWIYAMIHILFQWADVWHITYHLGKFEELLLLIPFYGKKVMTVHDPTQHSGKKNYEMTEKARIRCFKWADEYILLNNQQVNLFCEKYNIPNHKICISKLGIYNTISKINIDNCKTLDNYILYFGMITPYKGIEYLLEAMLRVHVNLPKVKLVVAGSGKMYFDMTPYKGLDYMIFENRYIGVSELAGFVRNCLFVVCPYKDATQSGVIQTAFALGTPVIATNVGDLPVSVKDGIYGTIVPPCDSDALAKAICELIENRGKLQRMKNNIDNYWKPLMSWSSIANDYLSVYRK